MAAELKIFKYIDSNAECFGIHQKSKAYRIDCYRTSVGYAHFEGDYFGSCCPYSEKEVLGIVDNLRLINPEYHIFSSGVAYLVFKGSCLDLFCQEQKQKTGDKNYHNSQQSGWQYIVDDPTKTFWNSELIANPTWDYSTGNDYWITITEF